MLSFIVQEEGGDQTLISFLKKRFKTTPLSLIYKLFRNKKVKVDGKNVRYYHYRLKSGEKIEIYDNYLEKPNSTIYPLSQSKVYFEIAYEDKNILFYYYLLEFFHSDGFFNLSLNLAGITSINKVTNDKNNKFDKIHSSFYTILNDNSKGGQLLSKLIYFTNSKRVDLLSSYR